MKRAGEAAKDSVDWGSKCRLCGTHRDLQAHHIVPRRIKRVDAPDNLVTLCLTCHNAVHDKKVDLAPALTAKEQAMAVLITGSIESARMLLTPSAYKSHGQNYHWPPEAA